MSNSVSNSLGGLTPEQSQRALLVFFDLLPARVWPGGAKPSPADLEALGDQVRDASSETTASLVKALIGPAHPELKGEAARALLRRCAQDDELKPLVEQAVARARQPDMAPVPLIIGVFILALAVLPEVEVLHDGQQKKFHLKFNPAERAGQLVGKLTDLVKALPKGLLGQLQ